MTSIIAISPEQRDKAEPLKAFVLIKYDKVNGARLKRVNTCGRARMPGLGRALPGCDGIGMLDRSVERRPDGNQISHECHSFTDM